jgi:hypothetical protein
MPIPIHDLRVPTSQPLIPGFKSNDVPPFAIKVNIAIALIMVVKLKPRSVDYHLRPNVELSRSIHLCDYTVKLLEIVTEVQ